MGNMRSDVRGQSGTLSSSNLCGDQTVQTICRSDHTPPSYTLLKMKVFL